MTRPVYNEPDQLDHPNYREALYAALDLLHEAQARVAALELKVAYWKQRARA